MSQIDTLLQDELLSLAWIIVPDCQVQFVARPSNKAPIWTLQLHRCRYFSFAIPPVIKLGFVVQFFNFVLIAVAFCLG